MDIIRLTESDLHSLITETVNQILAEDARIQVSPGIWVNMTDKELAKWKRDKNKARMPKVNIKRQKQQMSDAQVELKSAKHMIITSIKSIMTFRKLTTFFKSGASVFFGGNKVLTFKKIGNIERYLDGAELAVNKVNQLLEQVQIARGMNSLKAIAEQLYDACDNAMHKIDKFLEVVDNSGASQLRGISRIFTYPNYGINSIHQAFNQDVEKLPEILNRINYLFKFREEYTPWESIGGHQTMSSIIKQQQAQSETNDTEDRWTQFMRQHAGEERPDMLRR